jgi:hypothetical protein
MKRRSCNVIFAEKTEQHCICSIKNRKRQNPKKPFVDDPSRNSRLQEGENTYKSVLGEEEFLKRTRGTYTITVT